MDVLSSGICLGQLNAFILVWMREQSGATWLNNIVMEEVKMLVCLCAGFFFFNVQCIAEDTVHPTESSENSVNSLEIPSLV